MPVSWSWLRSLIWDERSPRPVRRQRRVGVREGNVVSFAILWIDRFESLTRSRHHRGACQACPNHCATVHPPPSSAPERRNLMPDLLETIEDGIAILTLNRPEALNALSDEIRFGLVDALTRLGADNNVGCIVIT